MFNIGNPCIYMHADGRTMHARVCCKPFPRLGRSLVVIEPEENGAKLRRVTVRITSVRELTEAEKASL